MTDSANAPVRSHAIQVYRIPIPKDRLRAIPLNERVLRLLLGYVSNQISMLLKLTIFSANNTPNAEFEQIAAAVQTQMLVRLMVGAVNEGWEVISTRLYKTPCKSTI